ncbi:MAG TPA: PKD domain-containing protein [Mycobacteriales bacterium]|nr:PKD domain-containing protein [Mycobacteriales bacterium]
MTRRLVAAALAALVGTLLAVQPAWGVNAQHDKVVSAVPSAATPNAVNGTVFGMAQVGTTIVMGGSFTSVTSPNRATTYNLPYVVAFNQATGAVNTAFAPALDGQVNAVLPGPTAGTVYVGGSFNNIGGVKAKGLVLLNVSNGSRVAGFATLAMNGIVNTVARSGNRMFLGGTFTTIGASQRGGIASFNATTGALDSFITSKVTVNHNWTATNGGAKGGVGVSKIDVTPDGSRLVAIGNFKLVDGLSRDQVAMWDTSGATAALRLDWQTHRYEPACFYWAYDSYIRDVDFSPDGTYFVIGATGGGNGTLCDTAARFETGAVGTDVQPTWVDYAGGDTVLSIAITGTAVYAGGHMRWMNNPNGNDAPGGGAVPRPGIVALDPANGIPLSWNPGRNPRGAGAYSLLATPQGLYVGSDTDYIGNRKYFHGKIAFFPLADGAAPASTAVQALPGGVYLGASQQAAASNVLYRVNAGGGAVQATDSGPDWSDGSANVSGGSTAGWSPVANVNATVPASTPRSIFDSERYGQQSWTFPVPAGATVKVRLYFANRYPGTSAPGQRVFTVAVNGTAVLPSYDIAADVGDQTGTMKEFANLTGAGDGAIHVDLTNHVENALINGIEIVRTDVPEPPAGAAGALVERNFDGSTAGAVTQVSSPLDFSTVRGATLVGNQLYYGKTDGLLYRRAFTGTTFGAESLVDPYNDPAWINVDTGSGQTFKGARPSFYNEIVNVTAMFTDGSGQLYYKLLGDSRLYKRAFSADSGIIHDDRIATGTTLPDITGAFFSGGNLYYATRADGNLTKVGFSAGTLTGAPTVVSGPSADGVDWRSRALFLGPRIAANTPPTAVAAVTCSGLDCTASSAGSSDPDGTIASTSWAWGDGATGPSASHTYAAAGTYTVTLTVTDNDGATATATKSVTVTAPPPVTNPIAFRATAGTQVNATSASVTVPAAVQAGDGLVLVMTSNSSTVTYGDPAGWTLVDTATTTGITTRVYSRVATASDAGSAATVTSSAIAKLDLRLAAYANTRTSAPVSVLTKAVETTAVAAHTTPAATVTGAGSWVLSYWADKSGTTTAWTAPDGQTVRGVTIGTGTGRVTSLLTDANAAAAAGPAGGLTATTDAPGTKATMLTIVLAPAS